MTVRAVTALDLGNNGTRAARVSASDSKVLTASNGRSYIITAIARRGDEWVVGEEAEALVREDPTCGIVGLKKLIKNGVKQVEIAGEAHDVVNLVGRFVQLAYPKLPDLTQQAPLVISYPTGSTQSVRQMTVACLQASGCTLLPIPGGSKSLTIDEATALATAALHESGFKLSDGEGVLVADFGHITGDFTKLVAKAGGQAEVTLYPQLWDGSGNLGGLRVDNDFIGHIKFNRTLPTHTEQAALMAARVAKTLLARSDCATFRLAGFDDRNQPVGWEYQLTRVDLAEILKGFNAELHGIITKLIAGAAEPKINRVVVGGGFANLPEVSQYLREVSGSQELHVVRNPELATVKGAALWGAMNYGVIPGGVMVNPVIRRDVYLMAQVGDMLDVLTGIPAGTSVPTKPVVVEVTKRHIRRLRIAEATSGAINLTTTPTYFELPRDHRFVKLQADLTGTSILTSKSTGGPWQEIEEIDWSARPAVDQVMAELTKIADALATA